jgi:hypothetical protein
MADLRCGGPHWEADSDRALEEPMSRRFGRIAIAASLIAGLVVAGCGSSGSSSTKATATPPAITKPELVAKANAICTSGNGPILAAAGKLVGHPSKAEVISIVESTYVPAVEGELASIKALGVPPGEQATIARMEKLASAELNKLRSNPALVTTDVFGGFARVAHPYGLVACAPTF